MADDDDHFFHLLYAADCENEEVDDQASQAVNQYFSTLERKSGLLHKLVDPISSDMPRQFVPLRRVSSFPGTMNAASAGVYEPSNTPALKSYSSAPPFSSEIMSGSRSKRQKMTHSPLIPESLQIFRDQNFYFFPNDKKNSARRMLIEKFEQFGGNWIQEWHPSIHIIVVQNNLTYQDLLKFTKIDRIPDNVRVVDERFVSDCISFRGLLDTTQLCFQVRGASVQSTRLSNSPKPEAVLPYSSTPKPKVTHEIRTPSPEPLEVQNLCQLVEHEMERNSDRISHSVNICKQVEYNNQLSAAIEDAKSAEHLPLEESDEDEQMAKRWKGSKIIKYQNSFACMHKNDGKTDPNNPNSRFIEILQEMASYYTRTGDKWRSLSYRKAVSVLKHQTKLIATKEEALKLHGVGESLAVKIEEIVLTNGLRRLDYANKDPNDRLLQIFLQIYGVGLPEARRWVQAGYESLDELKTHAKLTKVQKIGVDHYNDFIERIPRTEVVKHGEIVRSNLQAIDRSFQVTIGGSYRRGSSSSSDIDLIITKPGTALSEIQTVVMGSLIPTLFKMEFIKVSLAAAVSGMWHGASALPGSTVWRRLDILLVPWDEIGAALIYFTGNDIFNRSIRLLARRKGMRLNHHGLFKNVLRDKSMTKMNEGELVESRSEIKIFEILGVPWRPPEDRNC